MKTLIFFCAMKYEFLLLLCMSVAWTFLCHALGTFNCSIDLATILTSPSDWSDHHTSMKWWEFLAASNLGRGCLILDGFSSHIFIFSLAQALKLFLFLIPYNSVQFSYFLCLHDIIFFDLQKDDCLVYFSHQLCFIILVQFHLVFCFL